MNYATATTIARLISTRTTWNAMPNLAQGDDSKTDWTVIAKRYREDIEKDIVVLVTDPMLESMRLLAVVGLDALGIDGVTEPTGESWLAIQADQERLVSSGERVKELLKDLPAN